MSSSPTFTLLLVIALAVFALGLVGNVFFWLQGCVAAGSKSGQGGGSTSSAALSYLVGAGLRGLVRFQVWRSFVVDSLLQRRLWRLSRLRWLMQVGFIWGTVELFFVGSVGNMLAEKGIIAVTKDTPSFALVNELGAVLILVSVVIALYRRFIAREIELPTSPGDALLVVLLATIVLSGVFLESVRLLAQAVPAEVGLYSFLGYALSLALRVSATDWSALSAPVWWFHIVFSLALVAYLPYSKLFHVFVSPLVLAARAVKG